MSAQEVVGRRVFSDTLVISEPFVEDELSLPSLLHIRRPARVLATQVGAEIKKRITPDLALSLAGGLTQLDVDRGSSLTGFDNLEIGVKYQFLRNPAHEAVGSLAVTWEVGGTGRAATGAESFDSVTPAVLVGKGLGDLPDSLSALKPFAITGALGTRIPTRDTQPIALEWGLVVEYSLSYLQSFVRNMGLPAPLDRLVPLVEMTFETPLDRNTAGRTTGTANVGAVWIGDDVQVGIESVVPINDRSGKNVGVRAFVRFSLESFFGGRMGRPLLGHGE